MNSRPEAERTSLILVSGHTFGAHAFAGIFSARAYLDQQIEVALMIGLDAAHASATVGYQSLEPLAAEHGVPYIGTSDGRLTSLADQIRAAAPAYLLVIGWSHLIPDEVLSIPATCAGRGAAVAGEFGCIGMHPTKLPLGRGQAPIPWTIIKGCDRTALSVFFLESGADTGPVIAQYDLDVYRRETAASLFHRLAHVHFTAGRDLAQGLGRRQITAQAQDPATATRWPKRRPKDGEIHPTMTCQEIDSLVRALLGPYPRAFINFGGNQVSVRAVEFESAAAGATGDGPEAVGADRIRFPCRDGVVQLLRQEAADAR
jgi:methionyl-tRNA formyltransferase